MFICHKTRTVDSIAPLLHYEYVLQWMFIHIIFFLRRKLNSDRLITVNRFDNSRDK